MNPWQLARKLGPTKKAVSSSNQKVDRGLCRGEVGPPLSQAIKPKSRLEVLFGRLVVWIGLRWLRALDPTVGP